MNVKFIDAKRVRITLFRTTGY